MRVNSLLKAEGRMMFHARAERPRDHGCAGTRWKAGEASLSSSGATVSMLDAGLDCTRLRT